MTTTNSIAMVAHAGSGNHGCEAIIDSTLGLLQKQNASMQADGASEPEATGAQCPALPMPVIVTTNSAAEDRKYGLRAYEEANPQICRIEEEQHMADHLIAHTLYYAYRKVTRDEESFLRYRFAPVTKKGSRPRLALSVGGDNYCYDIMIKDMMLTNSMLRHQGTETVLLGCSVEPDLMKEGRWARELREDLNLYKRIIARESLTYEAMLEADIPEEKVILLPDPAFTLQTDKSLAMPDKDTVGINVSPLVSDYTGGTDLVLENYRQLIHYILKETNQNCLLIPHVIWDRSNDHKPLKQLYEEFRDTGRVFYAPDGTARQLKGLIARCRFFVGARTHATIAAYSSGVPTLVLGYSVKARGIAKDLLGAEDRFLVPVQHLDQPDQITKAFRQLMDEEQNVRMQLQRTLPDYIARAERIGTEVAGIYRELV